MNKKESFFQEKGKVIKKLRNKFFCVEFENGKEVIADIGARFRGPENKKRSKIVEGDKVIVEITLKDPEKGQIIGFW